MVFSHAPKRGGLWCSSGWDLPERTSYWLEYCPTSEYAVFTLVIALVNLSFALAPAGVDGIVNRRQMEAGPALLRHTVNASVVVALVFVLIALAGYQMNRHYW